MSWRCRICGVRFDAPVIRERKENLDGENGGSLWLLLLAGAALVGAWTSCKALGLYK